MRILNEGYRMNTKITRFNCFSKICVLALWTKVDLELEGLNVYMAAGDLRTLIT